MKNLIHNTVLFKLKYFIVMKIQDKTAVLFETQLC